MSLFNEVWVELFSTRGIHMLIEAPKRLFTVDEYYRMGEAGILTEKDRVELVNGEIILKSPIGPKHQANVDRATVAFTTLLLGKAIVRIQGPVRIDNYNEPQPDVSLLRFRPDFYAAKHPGPEDSLLAIEVSDTTFRYDREVKLAIYAISRIPEYWIEDLNKDVILVFRNPERDGYDSLLTFHRGESISPLAFPEASFKVDDLLA